MSTHLAFLYNVRKKYPSLSDPSSQFEADLDDKETIDAIKWHLKKAGYLVYGIEGDEYAYEKLFSLRKRIHIAFNYTVGRYGKDRYSQIPAILEMLQIPYTGSGPLTQALILNKAKMKEVLMSHGIPTLPFQLCSHIHEKRNPKLQFPLIVKPVGQGSSAGITQKSFVRTEKELRTQIAFVQKTFHEPALIEPFLFGREFSVGLLGNPPRAFPIIEPNHKLLPKGFLPFDSLEVKWQFEEEEEGQGKNYLACPAKLSSSQKRKIEKICMEVFSALDMRDYCRIDLKCDEKGNAYVLDVNSPPGLMPPEISTTSYFPRAARVAKINYGKLLTSIIQTAQKRIASEIR